MEIVTGITLTGKEAKMTTLETVLGDKVEALEIVKQNLSAGDASFAESLIEYFKRKNTLSPKQEYWLNTLTERAMGKDQKPTEVKVGNFKKVYELFELARKTLKFPKIWLQADGSPVVLSITGEKSKFPNTVNVSNGGSFKTGRWYGRVFSDGTWSKCRSTYPEQQAVETVLKGMARDPVKAAKEYATLTGRCCFCGKGLSDEQSTAAGFGPVCAEKWGLTEAWKKSEGLFTSLMKKAA